jgi:succinate-semialdehyde dehydrogenase
MASKSAEVAFSDALKKQTSTTKTQVKQLVSKARAAQAAYDSFSQEQVDAIVKGIGKFVYDNAKPLAKMAVDETGIGVYEDKIIKNQGKARAIWNNLKTKKSRGVIKEVPESNMVLVAKPMGVVGAVTSRILSLLRCAMPCSRSRPETR